MASKEVGSMLLVATGSESCGGTMGDSAWSAWSRFCLLGERGDRGECGVMFDGKPDSKCR